MRPWNFYLGLHPAGSHKKLEKKPPSTRFSRGRRGYCRAAGSDRIGARICLFSEFGATMEMKLPAAKSNFPSRHFERKVLVCARRGATSAAASRIELTFKPWWFARKVM